jgi:hypothetical protein
MNSRIALETVAALAAQQIRIEDEVGQIEEALKRKNEELRVLSQERLPAAMDLAEVRSFTMLDGSKIEVKEDLACRIAVEKRGDAYQWLRDHGAGSIIKHYISVEFGKEETEEAQQCFTALVETYPGRAVEDSLSVHPGTLKALLKEWLRDGVNFPMDLFGAMPLTFAKIKRSGSTSPSQL